MSSPEELARLAHEVAREAGALVLTGWRRHPRATLKARADLVTEYDLRSERLIRARLGERAPDLPIVAEEEGGEPARGPTFYVDPLDGTTNFVHGHHFWAVSVGVLEGGEPVAGAVVAPALGVSWTGYRGGPALRDGAPCRVSATAALEDALVATGFPVDRARSPDDNFDSFVRVKRAAQGVRRCGAAAIDLCLVADGTYDGYWERRLHAWDLAAGAAVLLAAGGRVSALDGGPARLEVGHVIASNGLIHDALVASVA
ncbi:MAG: inositol monophosphatase family protein [Sorangiineae bacterium]|nr:inositol monophosphatase family protein [Polyangiaceae bacterium]MEB2324213.1 inositol monophosphatase family protein [Sorangiineae bacterium]